MEQSLIQLKNEIEASLSKNLKEKSTDLLTMYYDGNIHLYFKDQMNKRIDIDDVKSFLINGGGLMKKSGEDKLSEGKKVSVNDFVYSDGIGRYL